jgi:Asp-tRNA(Asn)/Glu-tRNA(Gln) amidotransferase C subunit
MLKLPDGTVKVLVEGVDRDEVLSQAPSVEDRRFRVPAILGEEP